MYDIFMDNIAFIDGQNLYLGTKEAGWKVDYSRFMIYLREKYNVTHLYYFIGYKSDTHTIIYEALEKSGFTLVFKEHNKELLAQKKGNVDTDIVFEIMKNLIDNNSFKKIILVSNDGDYKKLVDYLINKNRFEKILFPNKKFVSTLYRTLSNKYKDYIENIKEYIEYKQK
jgi:uncharacterized LabA/DUF88 family protein